MAALRCVATASTGMGALAPSPRVDAGLLARIEREVMTPTVEGLRADNTPFVGVLFAGLMVSPDSASPDGFAIHVLEFNVRFGDPEAEVILPLMRSDLLEVAWACTQGNLEHTALEFFTDRAAVTVVLASEGYPRSYAKGKSISGLEPLNAASEPGDGEGEDHTLVFHAGTKVQEDGSIVTSGGRVLAVTGLAADVSKAAAVAYRATDRIQFDGCFLRRDIAGEYHRPKPDQALRIGVLGSTRGSSLQPILTAIGEGSLTGAAVAVVVSNKSSAPILDKARAAGVLAIHIAVDGRSREVGHTLCGLLPTCCQQNANMIQFTYLGHV